MIHLHAHTTYSSLDGYGLPHQFISRLKEIGQTAMAITDHGNIHAHRVFAPELKKAGIKLIPGCEMYVKHDRGDKYFHLTVLARNNEGYANLCRLSTLSLRQIEKRTLVTWKQLKEHRDGLIFLSGCFGDGPLHREYHENRENVMALAAWMKRTLEDLYIEIQHTDSAERDYFRMVAKCLNIKCVPTLDVHYPRREDYPAQDLMFTIGIKEMMTNPKRMRLTDNLWLMSEDEVLAQGFTPEEIAVTDEIAARCDVTFEKLPVVTVENVDEKMVSMVLDGERSTLLSQPLYRERYDYEHSIITKLGLHAYFVIMSDVIREFKRRGKFIGPARGSSAGSLVCYLMGITEVDPVKHHLSFERFLDLNRKDYPDIDTDFPCSIRDEVVAYLQDKYGHDRIGHICSFSTYRGSQVFWDIARVYGFGPDVARALGKSTKNIVNDEIGMEDILAVPAIAEVVAKWPQFKMALALEGQVRQLGQHASGYAISPVPLSDVVAVGETVSVDKDRAEAMGLLKLDILGLNTLDIIQDVGVSPEVLYGLEYDDPLVYEEFRKKRVAGVFQFEGGAVRRALDVIPVTCLDDLSLINAIARPGASDAIQGVSIPDVIRHLIYKERYFVYQEELMAILRFLNFSWDDVTRIRKLVSKKKVTELEKYKGQFITELAKHCPLQEASNFWDTVLKCGSYSFNKSHSIAYSILGYICMWLKIYHPDRFCQAYLNRTQDDIKRRQIIREFIERGYRVEIEGRAKGFFVGEKKISGGLTSIKGIGEKKTEKFLGTGRMDKGMERAIVSARNNPAVFAPWACLDDFNNRYPLGSLPNDAIMVYARVWGVKDGKCYLEDKNGVEKAYFDERFVKLKDGKAYRLAVTKRGYCHVDMVREEL